MIQYAGQGRHKDSLWARCSDCAAGARNSALAFGTFCHVESLMGRDIDHGAKDELMLLALLSPQWRPFDPALETPGMRG